MNIIDLSLPIYSSMEVYPGDPTVKVQVIHTYHTHSWELREITMGSHTGTHVDAFSHMHPGGATIDKIPFEQFCGRAYKVNLQEAFPRQAGLIFEQEADINLLERILAAQAPFVGGLLTVDLQRALLTRGIVTYTELTNLERLPENTPFLFFGFPLKIRDGDGSPVRAVAIVAPNGFPLF